MEAKPLAWTPEHVQRFWDYWSTRPDREAHYFAGQVGKGVCKFIEQIGPVAGQDVLDYGAGPGFLSELLLQRGALVSAVEYSPAGVAELNHKFKRERFWQTAKQYEGGRLPWDDASFDFVCCLETIEHLLTQDLNVVLRELQRVLRPGGVLLLTTPNSENLRGQTVFCPECACEFHRWQHVRRWTPAALSDHLTELGFEVPFCRGLSFHDFQIRFLDSRALYRARTWRRALRAGIAAALDHLSPLPFPEGRSLGWRLRKGGQHHLAAVAVKPTIESPGRSAAA